MVISDSHRFLFVHVQKTGGTSLTRALVEALDARHLVGRETHIPLSRAHALYPRTRDYRSAAFVRNPWDRLVSWYADIRRNGRRLSWKERWRNPHYNRVRHQVLARTDTFESFLRRGSKIRSRNGLYPFSANQVDYLADASGCLAVDFVGRFERFEHDARSLLRLLGVEPAALPHLNLSEHGDYRDWYTPETRDLVAQRFHRDIAAFGYEF